MSERFELPHTVWTQRIDNFITKVGELISWVWLLLLGTIILNVTMRYVLGEGRIEFEELQWHFYAIGFLIGLSYVLQADEHVRVDLLRDHFSARTKAWIDFVGILLLLLPFLALVLYFAVPFLHYSLSINEASQAPGGLPFRWFIKAFLLIGFTLLLAATLSRLIRLSAFLFNKPQTIQTQ